MNSETLKIINKDAFRQQFIKYTRKAFAILPPLKKPKILDIGCGSGIPTLELVRISGGEVTGIDNDPDALAVLNQKIEEMKIEKHVKTINCSLFDLHFPDGSFDIIWSEGSIFVIGFEKGLRNWKHLIKDQGFLVVHDQYKDHHEKLETLEQCGYKLLDSFPISHQTWWSDFYQPYEKHLKTLQEKYKDNKEIMKALKNEENEINMYKRDSESLSSIFYVMQRI